MTGVSAGYRRLSALDLTAWEVLDAIWLASHLDAADALLPPTGSEEVGERRQRPDERAGAGGEPETAESPELPEPPAQPDDAAPSQPDLRLGPAASTGDLAWSALPDATGVARALRPLRQSVPSPSAEELDEVATAERAADDALWLPVFRASDERRWEIVLIVDDSPSMAIWAGAVADLTAALERSGAFRNVQVRRLATDLSGAGGVTLRGAGPGGLAHDPSEVLDPTNRRIVALLTDGWAPAWREGVLLPHLARWASRLPVAVLHLLPQRMWSRSGIHPRRVRLRAGSPGAATARLDWALRDLGLDAPDPAAGGAGRVVPVPVLELDARWLTPWTRLLTGAQPGWTDLAALLVGAGADGIGEDYDGLPTPLDRVSDFRASASPTAFALATQLAAAPLSLPLMRAVQRTLLPISQPAHLSEILISGLLRPLPHPGPATDPGRVAFDFEEGVREELLSVGRRADLLRVVRVVEEQLGQDMPAVQGMGRALEAPDAVPDRLVTAETAPFVRVEQAVLQALSGPHLARSRRLRAALASHLAHSGLSEEQGAGTELAQRAPSNTTSQQPRGRSETAAVPDPRTARHRTRHTAVSAAGASAQPGGTSMTSITAESQAAERRSSDSPAVWGNVPPRNPNFTGRQELLNALQERLQAGTTAVLPHALHGMGGVGKSQLAIEYLYRHLGDYDVVWWIPAERPAQIVSALVELAQRLSLRGGTEAAAAVPAILEALRTGTPYANWLLVFDNAESPESVRPYFPAGGPGCILVTSRNAQWATVARALEVDVFTREESKELLRRRGPELSDDEADRLAAALGDLPLAVEQAAAWRAETGMPAEEYLRLFDEKRTELLEVSPPLDYQLPVAAAWNVSLDQLEVKSPAALQLLQVCSFFAPEPISRALFAAARRTPIVPELDAALRDPIRLGRAIREIGRYSLARIDHRTNSIQMHRLVQAVLAGRMTESEREIMQHGAHLLLAASDPNGPEITENWARYGELYPHVVASDAIGCEDGWVRDLVINEAKYLYRWGEREAGRDLAQRAYDAWRHRLGEEHPQALTAAFWLGFFLFGVGQFSEAAALNSHILEVYRRTIGEDHEDTLNALGAVAADRRVRGDFAAALELSERVYEGSVRALGVDDPDTLNAAHNLGVSLRLVGDFARALKLDQETWTRRVHVLGEDHTLTLHTQIGLAVDQRELGDYRGACALQEQIVARYQRLLGDDNPATLNAMRHLSVARRKAGDHAGAQTLAAETLDRYSARYGDDYPDTMASALELSVDLRQIGNLRAAVDLGAETYARYCRILGVHHPHTLSARVNLAITHRLLGDPATAREINEDVLGRFRVLLSETHPLTLVCATNLASDLYAMGDHQAAHDRDIDTWARAKQALGEDHPSTLACASNVALDLRALGRTEEAETVHIDTFTRFERALGETHPASMEALDWDRRANSDIDPMPL